MQMYDGDIFALNLDRLSSFVQYFNHAIEQHIVISMCLLVEHACDVAFLAIDFHTWHADQLKTASICSACISMWLWVDVIAAKSSAYAELLFRSAAYSLMLLRQPNLYPLSPEPSEKRFNEYKEEYWWRDVSLDGASAQFRQVCHSKV